MSEEDELFWAKLQGDWTNANYRRTVAEQGKCLNTLIHDLNRGVSAAASRKYLGMIINTIRYNK